MRRPLGVAVLGLATCAAAVAGAEQVSIAADGMMLVANYARPAVANQDVGVVALHGCGGPWARRDGQWRDLLVAVGHPVLFPDSFGSRGLGSQCKNASRGVSPRRERRADAIAAATWLAGQPGMTPGGVVVMGWSNGGTTVLAAGERGAMPEGLVRGYVAFYPGCRLFAERAGWSPAGPLLIVIGEEDDWTPAAPCRALAARFPDRIRLVLVPGAYHDFDVPDVPIRTRTGLAFTAGRNGVAHTGTNQAGRAMALTLVPEWIAALPPATSR